MTTKQVLSVNTNQNAQGLVGVSIMVVDGDSVALAIVSKMLHTSGYKVITATRATDALRILRERQHELDLILTEVHLPDMDKYELLETMREISRLPIVILSGDNNENVMLGCLFKGAMFYFVKPITMNDIQNLWQFSRMKNQEENVVTEGSCSYQYHSLPDFRSNEASECRPVLYTCQLDAQKDKRKGVEQMYKDEEDSVSSNVPKKPKLIWTNELHNRFLQAIRILGVDSAHPKKILKHMNVPGLKKENISSHLQKYRLSLKREQDVIQKTMFKNSHFSPWNLEIGCSEVLETQFLMTRNQADLRGYVENQHNLNGLCMSTLPVCSAIFPPHVQSYLQNNQINTTHTSYSEAGMRIDRGKEQGSLNQTRNDNAEEFYQPKTAFSSTEDYGFEIATHDDVDILGNLAQQQEQCLMPPLSPLPLEVEPEISGPERVEVDELSDIASFSSELFRELANNDLL